MRQPLELFPLLGSAERLAIRSQAIECLERCLFLQFHVDLQSTLGGGEPELKLELVARTSDIMSG